MANRPAPGSARNRGSGIDLGAILLALGQGFGGIEYDEGFDKIQGPPTADGKGPGGAGPYKAKTWFDRNKAGELNAQYRTEELGKDNAVVRALRQKESEIPLKAKEEAEVGKVRNTNSLQLKRGEEELGLEFQPQKNAQQIDLQRALEIIRVLGTNNVLPTAANQATYDTRLTPEIIAALQSKYVADQQTNNLTASQANRGQAILKATADDAIRKALADSQFGAQESEQLLQNQDKLTQAGVRKTIQEPFMRDAQMVRDRLIPLGEGMGLFNTASGGLQYQTPDAMTKALGLANGKQK